MEHTHTVPLMRSRNRAFCLVRKYWLELGRVGGTGWSGVGEWEGGQTGGQVHTRAGIMGMGWGESHLLLEKVMVGRAWCAHPEMCKERHDPRE